LRKIAADEAADQVFPLARNRKYIPALQKKENGRPDREGRDARLDVS